MIVTGHLDELDGSPPLTGPLLDHLRRARWFAGKGRDVRILNVTALPWLQEAGRWPAVRFDLVEVAYADAAGTPTELYSVPVSFWPTARAGLAAAEIGRVDHPELGWVHAYDAAQDPAACRLLLRRLRDSAELAAGAYGIEFALVDGEQLGNEAELAPRTYTGQQSNTSVTYGDVAILKLFRRLETGRNLDIEVSQALSRLGVPGVPRLYGSIRAAWPSTDVSEAGHVTADLAMLGELLADAEDGWQLALDSLRRGTGFADHARALGHALAEIHRALAGEFGIVEVAGQGVAAGMSDRLRAAVAAAPELERYAGGLQRCFEAVAPVTLAGQRLHGDFHLGQTLHTARGWRIIDFEGEPAKSLAERAALDAVWRDVAGLLRSFDYAAASAPGPAGADWSESCRTACLTGYAEDAASPIDQDVLRAYLADKAVYEVVYETRHRPDWVAIPLQAVARLAEEPAKE